MNFISTFLAHTEEFESPTSYITWSAYATLSAILKDNVWFEFRGDKVYPNIFVIIIAKSSSTRKDPPVRFAEKLIREIGNTKIIAGTATIQGAIKKLSESYTNEKNIRLKGARGVFLSGELANLLIEDPAATSTLTELYDSMEVWDKTLASIEYKLQNVCLTLLAASNDTLFKRVFKQGEVFGGLLARTFLISESRRRHLNSRMYSLNENPDLKPKLLDYLQKLSRVNGAVTFTENARKRYHEWYETETDEKFDSAGIRARMPARVLKLCMLIAAAREEFLTCKTVHESDVVEAVKLGYSLLKNYNSIISESTHSPITSCISSILKEMLKEANYTIHKKILIRRLLNIQDINLLDKALATLLESGYILTNSDGSYTLTQVFLNTCDKAEQKMKKETTNDAA